MLLGDLKHEEKVNRMRKICHSNTNIVPSGVWSVQEILRRRKNCDANCRQKKKYVKKLQDKKMLNLRKRRKETTHRYTHRGTHRHTHTTTKKDEYKKCRSGEIDTSYETKET